MEARRTKLGDEISTQETGSAKHGCDMARGRVSIQTEQICQLLPPTPLLSSLVICSVGRANERRRDAVK